MEVSFRPRPRAAWPRGREACAPRRRSTRRASTHSECCSPPARAPTFSSCFAAKLRRSWEGVWMFLQLWLFGLDDLDRVRRPDVQLDGLARRRLDEDKHVDAQAQRELQPRLRLHLDQPPCPAPCRRTALVLPGKILGWGYPGPSQTWLRRAPSWRSPCSLGTWRTRRGHLADSSSATSPMNSSRSWRTPRACALAPCCSARPFCNAVQGEFVLGGALGGRG